MIPGYQELVRPLLQIASDGRVHSTGQETVDLLSAHFNLNDEERSALLPSGTQRIINNRVGWAKTYLKKAGLLESPSRGSIRITERGLKVLQSNPLKIDLGTLEAFPEFRMFKGSKQNTQSELKVETIAKDKTPQELIDSAFQEINSVLAQDLLEEVKKCSPRFFEKLVLDLLLAMGYGSTKVDSGELTPFSNDKGIDGIIKEDSLGLDKVYVQAKRWENKVGRRELQEFVGALAGKRAKKGIFITTSDFSDTALKYIELELGIDTKVVLIAGKLLAELMLQFKVGVSSRQIYEIKRIDLDYFDEEG